MAKDFTQIKAKAFARNLSASLAGLRAGGAMAIDQAMHKIAGDQPDAPHSEFAQREAKRFVSELGKLKGSYVKIGQMLALFGEHFLPPVLTEALHQLEDSTQPLPWHTMEPAIRAALGPRYYELDIQKNAIAAASMAQVHRATIRSTGQSICLKVQYPGLAGVIDSDFDAVVRMLLLARWLKTGRDLDSWLAAMRAQLHIEMDYHNEKTMANQLDGHIAALANRTPATNIRYALPRFYRDYCSKTTLAMDYIEGENVNSATIAALPQARRNALAQAMLDLFFLEVFDWELIQTDPNFGNYLIRLGDGETQPDELVLLDFGAVKSMAADDLDHLRGVIAAGLESDMEAMIKGLQGLGWLVADASIEAQHSFADFCMHLLEPLQKPETLPAEYLNADGEYHWANSQLIQRAGKAGVSKASSRHFTTPSKDFLMIARKLTGVFTFIAALNAEFNGYPLTRQHIERWRENH